MKKWLGLTVTGIAILGLVGCGNKNDGKKDESSASSATSSSEVAKKKDSSKWKFTEYEGLLKSNESLETFYKDGDIAYGLVEGKDSSKIVKFDLKKNKTTELYSSDKIDTYEVVATEEGIAWLEYDEDAYYDLLNKQYDAKYGSSDSSSESASSESSSEELDDLDDETDLSDLEEKMDEYDFDYSTEEYAKKIKERATIVKTVHFFDYKEEKESKIYEGTENILVDYLYVQYDNEQEKVAISTDVVNADATDYDYIDQVYSVKDGLSELDDSSYDSDYLLGETIDGKKRVVGAYDYDSDDYDYQFILIDEDDNETVLDYSDDTDSGIWSYEIAILEDGLLIRNEVSYDEIVLEYYDFEAERSKKIELEDIESDDVYSVNAYGNTAVVVYETRKGYDFALFDLVDRKFEKVDEIDGLPSKINLDNYFISSKGEFIFIYNNGKTIGVLDSAETSKKK